MGSNRTSVSVLSIHPLFDTRIANHLSTLIESGFRVCYLNWSESGELPQRSNFDKLNLVHRQGSRRIGFNPLHYVAMLWWFLRSTFRSRPEVVHIHDLFLFPLAVPIRVFLRVPVVVDVHENFLKMQDIQRPFARGCYWVVLPFVSAVVATCDRNLPRTSRPTAVVPNCQRRAEFGERSPMRNEADVTTVCYFGTLMNRYRNIDLLLACARACLERLDHVEFKLGGSLMGDDADHYRLKFEELESVYPGRFHWYGRMPREQVVDETKTSDIGLIFFRSTASNIYGGSWNKIYEYLAVGAAIVATDGFDIAEQVSSRGAGIVVPAQIDEDDVVEQLVSLIEQPAQLQRMKDSSYALGQTYAWEDCSREYLRLYQSLGVAVIATESAERCGSIHDDETKRCASTS